MEPHTVESIYSKPVRECVSWSLVDISRRADSKGGYGSKGEGKGERKKEGKKGMVLEMRVEEGLIDSVLEAVTDMVADAEGMEDSFFHFYRKKRVVPGCNGVQARIRRAHASRARGFSSQPPPSIATLRLFLGLSNSLPQFDRLMLDLLSYRSTILHVDSSICVTR